MKVRSRLSWGRLQALKQPPDPPTSSFIMAKEAEISEMMLAKRAGRGDMAARKAIYTLHVRYLAAVCGRYVADSEDARDVLQESFVKIFGAIASFKDRGGQGSLRAWMARIVVNEALRFIRQSQRITFTELGDADGFDPPDDSAPPDGSIPAEVIYEQIRLLPDGYRTVFNLYVVEGFSHREIAAMLGISENTSASQLSRAKALLASRLKKIQSENYYHQL